MNMFGREKEEMIHRAFYGEPFQSW